MILLCYQLHRDALTETFAWLEASLVLKAGWKYVSMESGEHFVIGAIITTPELCADSWDFPLVHLIQVYSLYTWPLMHVSTVLCILFPLICLQFIILEGDLELFSLVFDATEQNPHCLTAAAGLETISIVDMRQEFNAHVNYE